LYLKQAGDIALSGQTSPKGILRSFGRAGPNSQLNGQCHSQPILELRRQYWQQLE